MPLIPREALFGGGTARTAGQLSPDGLWLTWIAPLEGVANVWIAPMARPEEAQPATTERAGPVTEYFWSPDSSMILYADDNDGDENHRLKVVDVRTREVRVLTSFPAVQTQIVKISPSMPSRILVGLNRRDPNWHDVFTLDLRSGKLDLVFQNTGYSVIVADDQLRLRLVAKAQADGSFNYFRLNQGRVEAKVLEHVPLADSRSTEPLGFAADNRTLYWVDSRGRDTAALVAHDMVTNIKRLLGKHPKADVENALFNPVTGVAEGFSVDHLRSDLVSLEPKLQDDFRFLRSRLPGHVSVVTRTRRDGLWLIESDPVSKPPSTYLYERGVKRLTKLFSRRPELDASRLATMHPISIQSRDGLDLVSYLTLPPDLDPDGDGRPIRPAPLVLFVHGGPWSRDVHRYNGTHQWLANRGYAVLSVNFRGSTGFGKRFISAGDREWGARMQDDLHDAAEWAIRNRVAVGDKVALFGGSYGGYATLAGMAFTPDAFACGVDVFGPSNLHTLLASLPPTWGWRKIQFYNRVGDPATPEGRAMLTARSPLFAAEKIKRPLLVVQPANDPRVKKAESDQIVEALRQQNIPVTYAVFPNEGHGLTRPENNIAFSAVVEQFLSTCLGGRAEPIGRSLETSSLEVPVGADLVRGLVAALGARGRPANPDHRSQD